MNKDNALTDEQDNALADEQDNALTDEQRKCFNIWTKEML